jgi:hypothetical protein
VATVIDASHGARAAAVARRVGDDDGLHPVRSAAQHLLGDVGAEAEPDQHDLGRTPVVEQSEDVLHRFLEVEAAVGFTVAAQVRDDDAERLGEGFGLRVPGPVVQRRAVQEHDRRARVPARPVADRRVGAHEFVRVEREHGRPLVVGCRKLRTAVSRAPVATGSEARRDPTC